jgi:hypothetical protein
MVTLITFATTVAFVTVVTMGRSAPVGGELPFC